jgi:hypothetical protein
MFGYQASIWNLRPCDQFFFLFHGNSLNTFVDSFGFGEHSLTRGRACNVQYLGQSQEPSVRGYNWVTKSLREINKGTWPSSLGILKNRSKSKLSYDRRSVDQSVLVSGHHLGSTDNFSYNSTEIMDRHLRIFTLLS